MDKYDRVEQIMHNLGYHKPERQETQDKMEEIRSAARDYAFTVINRVPEGRELAMACTEIENSCMHAIAGIARNEKASLEMEGF